MRDVILYGELAQRFGKAHRFEVATPAEAIKALSVNYQGFERFMLEAHNEGLGFKVVTGGDELTLDEVKHPASGEIKIIPVIMGAGGASPLEKILVGAALIAVSTLIPGSAMLFGSIGVKALVAGVGLSLAVSGTAQLLFPPQEPPGPTDRPENTPSNLFDGPIQTYGVGHPVPILYGKAIVSGAIISASISTEQIKQGIVWKQRLTSVTIGWNSGDSPPKNYVKREQVPAGVYDHQQKYNDVYWYYEDYAVEI